MLGVTGGGTIAYFTAKDTADNVFTIGNVKIEITEDKWDASVDHKIGPGVSFDKNPVIKNIGNNDAYVRFVVTVSDYESLMDAVSSPTFTPAHMFGGLDTSKWILYGTPTIKDNTIEYKYVYYQPLVVETSTEPLFEKVNFPSDLDVSKLTSLDKDFSITIKADAIQSESFGNVNDAFEAFDLEG